MSTHDTRRIGRAGIAAGAAATLAAGIALAEPVAPAGADADDNTVAIVGDTLHVTATDGADRVALRLAPAAPGTLQVDFGDDGIADASVDRAGFARIEVLLGRGSDAFRVDQVNGAFADEILTVHGSGGNDTFDGGDGAEIFNGGSGDDAADGNRGDDFGIMGSGSDSFRWDPGDGSDTIEGEGGSDTLDFNGAAGNELMTLTPNSGRALFLRDVANIRMDMDGVERLDLTALGGTDTVNVDDMTGTDFRRANIDLQGPAGGGDGAVDLVTVTGTNSPDDMVVRLNNGAIKVNGLQVQTSITGHEPTDRLEVDTLAGDDDVNVTADAAAAIAVAVDLGADG